MTAVQTAIIIEALTNPNDVRSANYLIHSPRAERLYQRICNAPAIDYHTHISPKAMAEDLKFNNVMEVLLGRPGSASPVFDHYLARLVTENGLPKAVAYGKEPGEGGKRLDDEQRFYALCKDFYRMAGNPTYHWVRRTLQEFFEINELPTAENAQEIWSKCNAKLATAEYSIRGLLKQRNIQVVATTDDPTDSLQFHQQYRAEGGQFTAIIPTWRPDKALVIIDDRRNDFSAWVNKLGEVTNTEIKSFDQFLKALQDRHDYFHENGCRAADIGLKNFASEPCFEAEAAKIFEARLRNADISEADALKYQSFMLRKLGLMNAEKGWVQQFHQGPIRDANGELFKEFGADLGKDFMGPATDIKALQEFLDDLNGIKLTEGRSGLARTIIYPLNPVSYLPVLSLIGGFQESTDGIKRIHLGVPWWFNDTETAIRQFIGTVAEQSCLARHIGMLSDSRSPVSAGIRFDYFRRILADELVKRMPELDDQRLEDIALDISYRNAREFFGFQDYISERPIAA